MKRIIKPILVLLISSQLFASTSYILGPGDMLDIQIINKSELSTKQKVAPDGTINLPLFGRYSVEGKSLLELQKVFKEHFSKYIQVPQLAITLEPRPIYVVQHDLKTETWEVKEAKSVAEAQALSGGKPLDINHGDVINVDIGKRPDWFEDNWYKVLTAVGVVAGIVSAGR